MKNKGKADSSARGEENRKKETDDGSMPLTGHLKEMRNRIVVCLIVFAAAFLICLNFAPGLITLLTDMGEAYQYTFVYLAPQELLMSYLNIALIGGIVCTVPVLAYEAYAFAGAGLSGKEKSFFLLAMIFGALCFVTGVLFAYFITVPFMLRFLIQFTAQVNVTDAISIGEYLNFLLTVFIIFGIVFEMPVVTVLLTRLGLLKARWLKAARKVMIVVIFFIAAVITPPDVVSQIMVAIPMIGLYQVSIVLCAVFEKKDSGESAS